jgi:hypothetical protein
MFSQSSVQSLSGWFLDTSQCVLGRCASGYSDFLLMACLCFLQRSEEVVSAADIPNTKINSINRGLRQRSKHGEHRCPTVARLPHTSFHDVRAQSEFK